VFEGVIFDTYQWEQKMFNGSTAIFEQLARDDGAFVVPVMEDGTIMLTKQEQPDSGAFVTFPGGRIDEGEDPFSAAKRELKEEAGLVSDDWDFWFATQPVGKIDWIVFYFIAKNCVQKHDPRPDAGERIVPMPVSWNDFVDTVTSDSMFHSAKIRERVLEAQLNPALMKALKTLFGL